MTLIEPGKQAKVFDIGEDRVVRDERNVEPDGCRGYPTVGFVGFLSQAVSGLDAPGTQCGVDLGEARSRPYGVGLVKFVLQLLEPRLTSSGQFGAEAQFSDGDKRDDGWSAVAERTVSGGQ